MRKLILYINSSFNGVVTGDPKEDKSNFMVWTNEEFIEAGSECALRTMETVDTLLLGHKTYEDLSRPEKWPSVKDWPGVNDLALALGKKINEAHKYVVTNNHSKTKMNWGEYEAPKPISGDIEKEIKDLKNAEGGDIVIFGSPTLVRSLTEAGLIDEYHIQIRPVVMNVGEHLFDGIQSRKDLELVDVEPLKEGTLFVRYKANNKLVIKKERRIKADPSTVWKVLTAPVSDWNGITIETKSDWKQGSALVFSFVWDGKEYADKGKIIELEQPKLFAHTYWSAFSGLPDEGKNYSLVRYELIADDGETILKLTHSNFATDTMYEHSDKNWEDTLDKMKEQCERM